MSRWFRFYDGALDDPKVQRLAPEMFKFWVNLLCLASRNDGCLPVDKADIAFAMRVDESELESYFQYLGGCGLLDTIDDKTAPHNWDKRQFKSDDSAERVKRHRDKCNGDVTVECNGDVTANVTPPETEQKQNRTEKKEAVASATVAVDFDKFKKEYPKRGASNPWQPALQLFNQAVKAGHDPEMIIAAAQAYREECNRNKITGTDKVAQAQTWLRQVRFLDYDAPPEQPKEPAVPDENYVKMFKQVGRWHHDYGPEPGKPGCRASPEILEQHGYQPLGAA